MKQRFVFADDETGELLRAEACEAAHAGSGETAIEHPTATNATHYFDGAELIEYTSQEYARKAQRPAYRAQWSNETRTWVDLRTFEQRKAAKNGQINAWRLAANRGTFTFGGHPISADELSRSDIDGVNGEVGNSGQLPADFPGAWKAADNSYVPILNVAAWKALYAAMVAQGMANFAISETLKAALSSATTDADLDAIVWPT